MSNRINSLFIFSLGVGVGSIVTWNLLKDKYVRLAQEEIDSVKEVFSKKEAELDKELENIREKEEYTNEITKQGYADYSGISKSEDEKESRDVERPYVITPEDFGSYSDYDTINLTYYADGILADEDDELVDDVEDIVGFDSLNHFGEYENDAVHVRNDARKADYEILRDSRTYSDVVGYNVYGSETGVS